MFAPHNRIGLITVARALLVWFGVRVTLITIEKGPVEPSLILAELIFIFDRQVMLASFKLNSIEVDKELIILGFQLNHIKSNKWIDKYFKLCIDFRKNIKYVLVATVSAEGGPDDCGWFDLSCLRDHYRSWLELYNQLFAGKCKKETINYVTRWKKIKMCTFFWHSQSLFVPLYLWKLK